MERRTKRTMRTLVRALLVGIAALLGGLSTAVAEPVECVPLGTMLRYEFLGQARAPIDVPVGLSQNHVVHREDGFSPTGAITPASSRATGATFYRCTVPGDASVSLGAGTVAWKHDGSAAKLIGKGPADNRVNVSLMDAGPTLDGGDLAGGTIVGATTGWPVGINGTPIAAAVDFAGQAVAGTFDLRLSSDVQSGNAQVWSAKVRGLMLDVAVSPAGESEADRLIAQLAAALNIDPDVLRQLLAALAVPR